MKDREKRVEIICEWRLELDDNMLYSLLVFYYEKQCLKFMGVYRVWIGPELYLFALINNNTEFM